MTKHVRPSVVYMATNKLNGKRYIGVTVQRLRTRAVQHASLARTSKRKLSIFSKAMLKYGMDGFDWIVLDNCSSLKDGMAREIELIANTKPEYNSTIGGEGTIGDLHLGNKYRLGKSHTAETRDRLRIAAMCNYDMFKSYAGLGPKAMAKRVVCISDGTIHDSASAAARAYGASKSAVIEVCLRREWRRSTCGRVFRYYGDHYGGTPEANTALNAPKRNGSSKLKGAHKNGNKWVSAITVNGQTRYLGIFDTPEKAHAAYMAAKQETRAPQ